ncbi:hypothetical protein [Microtetraspora malaysiensis]
MKSNDALGIREAAASTNSVTRAGLLGPAGRRRQRERPSLTVGVSGNGPA